MIRTAITTMLAATLVVCLAACGSSGDSGDGAQGGGEIKVGVISNLTGPDTVNGREMVRGVQLAVDQINAAGGANGHKLKLIVEDSEYKPVSGVQAARKLIDVDKVAATISIGGSSVMVPVAKYAQTRDAVVVNTGASSTELRHTNGTVFSVIPLDDQFAGGFAKWVFDQGARRVAVLMPSNPFGTGLNKGFTDQFTQLGGEVVASVNFKENQQDYRPDLQRVLASRPEAIITGAYGADATLLWKQSNQIGLTAPWLVAYPTGLPIRNAQGRLFGIDFGYNLPSAKAFRDAYAAAHGSEPKTASAVYAYDGMKLLGDALGTTGGKGSDALRNALRDASKTFSGATGQIQLDADGQRTTVPYVYLAQQNNGDFVPLKGHITFAH